MPFVAFGLAQLLGMSPTLTAGFAVLGAVAPKLVTPVMIELGLAYFFMRYGGDFGEAGRE